MPGSTTRDRLALVMETIVAYAAAQPAAADTARGVRDVWLQGTATSTEVEVALEQLVSRGALVERALPDGSVLYSSAGEGGTR